MVVDLYSANIIYEAIKRITSKKDKKPTMDLIYQVLFLNRKICHKEWDSFFYIIQAQNEFSHIFYVLEGLLDHTFEASESFRLTFAESFLLKDASKEGWKR